MLQNLFLTVVVENSACKNDAILQAQHGLSMLLDLGLGDRRVKLLWDTGATAGVLRCVVGRGESFPDAYRV